MKKVLIEEIREKAKLPLFKKVSPTVQIFDTSVDSARKIYSDHCLNTHQQLLDALKNAQALITELRDGETCDHSVGICWCGCISDQEEIKNAIENGSFVEIENGSFVEVEE